MRYRPSEDDAPEIHVFFTDQRLKNLAPATIDTRIWLLRYFAEWLARPLTTATAADLRAFVASRRPGLTASSQVTEIATLKVFYSVLVERGLIESNPADTLHGWRVHSSEQPLSLARVEGLLREASQIDRPPTPNRLALAQRDRACLELLFATGMRASEVVATTLVDLDLVEGSVLVRRAKRGDSRRIPLPAPAVAEIRRYIDEGRVQLLGSGEDPGNLFIGRTVDDAQEARDSGGLRALVIAG